MVDLFGLIDEPMALTGGSQRAELGVLRHAQGEVLESAIAAQLSKQEVSCLM